MLVAVLTVTLCPPITTRLTRILFLCWIAVVFFSISPVFAVPTSFINVLSIVRIPMWPIVACYSMSTTGTIGLAGMSGLLLEGVYVVGLALIAGYLLERRELLLY
ncbi:MAG TPA: hypothetical protein VJQ26_04345, partial [Ktedonobacteraceae bacterium]|nr:hypothetical protein [Ktedonobacteraceae bacterium]